MLKTYQIKGEIDPAGAHEIREILEKHGSCCINYLEAKFGVLILHAFGTVEVYQVPEIEEA